MRANEFITESVAGPKNCWPGHRKVGTQPGTGKNKGKRVNDCEKIKKKRVAEGVPQPGPSSGAPKQFGPNAKIQTRQMTVGQIISSIPGVPYYNNVVDDWDAKDYHSWNVTEKAIEYAEYFKKHPESLAQLDPIIVLNGKFEDGAHRVSAIWLLQQRMDPKNPLWKNAKLNVQFVKQGVAEVTGDTQFDKMMKRVAKKPTQAERRAELIRQQEERKAATKAHFANGGGFGPNPADKLSIRKEGVAESFNGEYDDEAGMAEGNLHTLSRAVNGLLDTIDDNDNLPEWCQEKIAKAEMMLVSVWDYLQSQKERGIDPSVAESLTPDQMFDIIEEMVEHAAAEHGVDPELIWEEFESVDDVELFESAAWRRKEGKSKKGGLNAKGVASYRRENPGSKLQTAVTTKPSKLKKGSKAAKRRKSFCARMGGVKGPMKKPNGKPTRKALALRKWNC